jgi:hypothetical protein
LISALEFRLVREAPAIPGRLVCGKAGINRGRLSEIEKMGAGSAFIRRDANPESALVELTKAQLKMNREAARVGWHAERL